MRDTYFMLRRRFPELKKLANNFEAIEWIKKLGYGPDALYSGWYEERKADDGSTLYAFGDEVVVKSSKGEEHSFRI